ncbi:hypothetical protein M758_9G087100 [Ceratodon purpureus]|nr:hypothetical protein M758_9G087100 [Ceratodon purpureus]KAG0605779.1 hypothetical protein M758_9G087100 [Ceratodon purpureus]
MTSKVNGDEVGHKRRSSERQEHINNSNNSRHLCLESSIRSVVSSRRSSSLCWIPSPWCPPLAQTRMTRGKQKIEAQKKAAERNEKPKGSQIEARSAGLKTVCSVCKAPLANYKQLVDHYGSKHPKEAVPPAPSS